MQIMMKLTVLTFALLVVSTQGHAMPCNGTAGGFTGLNYRECAAAAEAERDVARARREVEQARRDADQARRDADRARWDAEQAKRRNY
jgi:hypothetical protein